MVPVFAMFIWPRHLPDHGRGAPARRAGGPAGSRTSTVLRIRARGHAAESLAPTGRSSWLGLQRGQGIGDHFTFEFPEANRTALR